MNAFTVLIVLGAILYYLYIKLNKNKDKKSPPGPIGLPVIGNILSLGNNQTKAFCKLADKYGDIFKFKLGPLNTIVINDPKMIKQAFNEIEFSGRPNLKVFNYFSGGKVGIISSDGKHWEEQRRFTLRHLRDFGFGKNYMEDLIMEEVREVITWFKREEGKSISVNSKLGLAVLNSLWMIVTGIRYSHDDPKLSYFQTVGNDSFKEISRNPFAFFMEWTLDIFPVLTGWEKIRNIADEMANFFRETIEDHKKTYSKGQPSRDFVDAYFSEMGKTTDSYSSFYRETGEKALKAVIGDLFGAGSETTSNTLTWSILYLLTHPEAQRKLHNEIDQVIGKNRLPTLADKANMPYTEAIMNETLRKSSLTPQGVFHTAMKDTTFNGYHIPKDTVIMANQYYVHHNPKLWNEPEKFKPERFLSPDGKTFKKSENLIPFSTGKRQCLGENLARDEFFLFMTTIFQRFNIEIDPSKPVPTLEPEYGFILSSQPFSCIMKDRLS